MACAIRRTVAWLWLVRACAQSKYWMLWPDAYARGGGHCNQLEQALARLQCATWVESPHRTLVLSELRADRPRSQRFAFERLYDIDAIRTVCDVATWHEFVADCDHRAVLASCVPNISGDQAFHEYAADYAPTVLWQTAACATMPPPRCTVGLKYTPFAAASCPKRRQPRKRLFKSGRTCRGISSQTCRFGFDWSSSLNATHAFRGLVEPARAADHFDPCAARAISRLEARHPPAADLLEAFQPAPALRRALNQLRQHLGLRDGTYNAVHVRLGDFASLCSTQHTRTIKFCPPQPSVLSKGVSTLLGDRPILLLSDEPRRAAANLAFPRLVSLNTSYEALGGALPRLILEIELAVTAHTFLGVACSTVSQWIVKRRDARFRAAPRPFFLWP